VNMKENIGIFIYYEEGLIDLKLLHSLSYGIEEEGIPYIIKKSELHDYRSLSQLASEESQLDVGIGLDSNGNVCIHHSKLPDHHYLFESNFKGDEHGIIFIGANGARLVKGIPFKAVEIC